MKEKNNGAKKNSFEAVLQSAVKLPYVQIDRAEFLTAELAKYYDTETVQKAIDTNPAQAGICVQDLEKIANACIVFETRKVTALSATAGLAGIKTMAIAIPADTVQFYGHVLRILQKLAYLYGWHQIVNDESKLDDETVNQLTLFVGVMFGVSAANAALTKIAGIAAMNVPKKLVRAALTKGTIYPVVKQVSKSIGINMTKAIFAKSVGKVIPVVGAVASGGMTYAFFRPMALRLKKYLAGLPAADVDFYNAPHDFPDIIDIDIDIDFEEIALNE